MIINDLGELVGMIKKTTASEKISITPIFCACNEKQYTHAVDYISREFNVDNLAILDLGNAHEKSGLWNRLKPFEKNVEKSKGDFVILKMINYNAGFENKSPIEAHYEGHTFVQRMRDSIVHLKIKRKFLPIMHINSSDEKIAYENAVKSIANCQFPILFYEKK